MNAFQVRKLRKKYHHWSKSIKSYDFRLTPRELRAENNVSDDDFRVFVGLPFCKDETGTILVNEALPQWELTRDLLLALDRLPDSLLKDIYEMDSRRYAAKDVSDVSGDSEDEAMRKVLYRLLPEIIWAHSFVDNN